jgi:hypothetical protein
VLDTVKHALVIVSELRAVNANEEKIATLKGTLTILRSQLAAMIELKACPVTHAPPPNTASAPTGAEGGPPCSCSPQPCYTVKAAGEQWAECQMLRRQQRLWPSGALASTL